MAESKSSQASPKHVSSSDLHAYNSSIEFIHTVSGAGRLLPSSSQWNSIELEFNHPLFPQTSTPYDSLPSKYSKSYDCHLGVTDRTHFKRFLYTSVFIAFMITGLVLLVHLLAHKHQHHNPPKNLTLAVTQAVTFFDAQKCNVNLLKLYNISPRIIFWQH